MWLRRLHRWLGLGLGAWFVLVGLTGAILLFEPEIETRNIAAASAGPALPLGDLLAAAGTPIRIWPGERFRADYRDETGRTTRYFDPATAAPLGEVRQASQWVHWVHALHRGLLLGRPGDVLVGLLGIPLLALLGAGLALWLRRDAVPWREKLLSVGSLRGRRRLANQHRDMGLRALLPLVLAVGTGIGMAFPQTVQWALYRLIRPVPAVGSAPGAAPVDLAGAVRLALAQRPGWQVVFIDLPMPGSAPGKPPRYGVELAPPAAWPGQGTTVLVDPLTGALPEIIPADPVGRVRGWIIALHAGTVFGMPHRLAMLLVALLPGIMGWLGLRLWSRARQARRQLRTG